MKILFIGEMWHGSNARSLCDAFHLLPDLSVAEIGTDFYVRSSSIPALRLVNRLFRQQQIEELKRKIESVSNDFQPDVIVIFKGWHFDAQFIRSLKQKYAPVVNVFPDASPHAHGDRMKEAMAEYDMVISTKKYHPPNWKTLYGYTNTCLYVPHGYSTSVHRRDGPIRDAAFDVVMIASARDEYADLIQGVTDKLKGRGIRYAIGGDRWQGRKLEKIAGVTLIGEKFGAAYTEWLRKGKIVIAPVQTSLQIGGIHQPGDEVSTRSFECAAAQCFFLHRRTSEAKSLYEEDSEVPMYESVGELADKIEYYLPRQSDRDAIAAAAHKRAVPAYCEEFRAVEIVEILTQAFVKQRGKAVSPSFAASYDA